MISALTFDIKEEKHHKFVVFNFFCLPERTVRKESMIREAWLSLEHSSGTTRSTRLSDLYSRAYISTKFLSLSAICTP